MLRISNVILSSHINNNWKVCLSAKDVMHSRQESHSKYQHEEH